MCRMTLEINNGSSDPAPCRVQQCSRLLELPNEILLNIGQNLTATKHLCQLSLVCLRLKHVAQEALMKGVVLPPHHMPDLIRTLCDRPDLCDKISSLDLGKDVPTDTPYPGNRLREWKYFDKCRELVGSAYHDRAHDEYTKGSEDIGSREFRFFLAVILKACPSIKEMVLKLPGEGPDSRSAAWGKYHLGSLTGNRTIYTLPLSQTPKTRV